jgi:pimeloyl-ACP methyl ester carboxylesterase
MQRKVLCWSAAIIVAATTLAIWGWRARHVEIGSAVVNGHRIEYARHGSGSPALVVIAGGFGGGDSKIPDMGSLLTQFKTTAFYYDRPGTGNSEPARDGRTPSEIIDELHTLLKAVGIPPPYILFGRSGGALYSRAYAIRYPNETAGLVLSDGSHERQWLEFRRIDAKDNPEPPPDDPHRKMPEFSGLSQVFLSGKLGITGSLPDVPMVVITSLRHGPNLTAASPEGEAIWRRLHDEIFESTTHGMHIVTNESGHSIKATEPDLETNAITWVLQVARADEKRARNK